MYIRMILRCKRLEIIRLAVGSTIGRRYVEDGGVRSIITAVPYLMTARRKPFLLLHIQTLVCQLECMSQKIHWQDIALPILIPETMDETGISMCLYK